LPTVIAASGELSLNVHVQPGNQGTHTTNLHLRYQSGAKIVDTTIVLTLQVLYNLPVEVGLRDTLVDMGVVNAPCSEVAQWITLNNTLCRNLTIANIAWEKADSE